MPNVSRPPSIAPLLGVVTKDSPSPLEAFYRARYPNQHPIPYDHLAVRKSLALFDAMLGDETVAYAHRLKIVARLSSGWSLVATQDKEGNPLPGADVVMDHIQAQIEQWDRFEEFLEQMLDAMRQGFKLGEIVTKDGRIEGRRAWVIDDVLVRNSRFFAFDVDPSGRIRRDGVLEYIDQSPDGGGIQGYWNPQSTARHAAEKFVRWAYCPIDSNAYSLYGRSDFLSVYRPYFLKDVDLKGWGETLDTFRSPIPIGVARKGLTDAQRADFLAQIQRATQVHGMVIPAEYLPDEVDLDKALRFHEVEGKADQFATQAEYLDKCILRGLLVGQLVAESGSEGRGSYALGKQHTQIFLKVMDHIGKSLGRAIGDTLFKPMLRWNLGEDAVALCPHLRFNAAGDAETSERAMIVETLIGAGLIDAREPWVREYVGNLPKLDADLAAEIDAERKARLEADTRPPTASGGPPKGKAQGLAAGDGSPSDEAHEPWRAPEPEEAFLDDTGLTQVMDAVVARAERAIGAAWRAAIDGPGGVKAQARVAFTHPEASDDVTVDEGPILAAADRMVVESMVCGAADAFLHLNMRLGAAGREQLAAVDEAPEDLATKVRRVVTIDLDEFAREHGVDLDGRLREVAKRVRVSQAEIRRAAELRIQQVRGEMQAQIERLREEAREGIRTARTTKQRADLRKAFRSVDRKWSGVERDLGNEQSAVVRTLTNAAWNEGRVRLYRAAPKGTIVGLMYSAIRDERTTPFCRAWDRFRALVDDEVWDRITPPNHWHCRSSIVPILAGEATEAALRKASRRRPAVEPATGFKRAKFRPTIRRR